MTLIAAGRLLQWLLRHSSSCLRLWKGKEMLLLLLLLTPTLLLFGVASS
jgi:hypothetical protein